MEKQFMQSKKGSERVFLKNPGDDSLGGCISECGELKCVECGVSRKVGCLDVMDSTNSFFVGTFPGLIRNFVVGTR